MARSNSAKAPTICIIMRPAGVVVSMFSVIGLAARFAQSCTSSRKAQYFRGMHKRWILPLVLPPTPDQELERDRTRGQKTACTDGEAGS
jgi:hypothetical protein